ncbi:MAG: J domain-containing protein [Deltaproteobacteria bacterium]|nr:J domain-containing protein [Deltaproteobacteria bacterium]
MDNITIGKKIFERRDPCAPVLRLGKTLFEAGSMRATGVIEIIDKDIIHHINVSNGGISEIDGNVDFASIGNATQLFHLNRPNVKWQQGQIRRRPVINPSELIFSGVTARRDLFDPASISERIPLSLLQINESDISILKKLPVGQKEIDFFKALTRPTPVSMALYKRGLEPKYAASIVVSLNILGVWKNIWTPGELPRLTTAYKIIKKAEHSCDDFEILDLTTDDIDEDVNELDRKFRHLCLELHPDKNRQNPEQVQAEAKKAFEIVSSSYTRLKSISKNSASRRKRPVNQQHLSDTSWQSSLALAESELIKGNIRLAKKSAFAALAMSPPKAARTRLKQIIISAA